MRPLHVLLATVVSVAIAVPGQRAFTQAPAPNTQPNPYRLVMNWAQLPTNMMWGQVIAFDFDRAGNVYAFHRNDPAILKFSPDGKLLKSWGSGIFVQAHGLTVDRFGFIWTADSDAKDGKGGQVLKWDANGNLLMSLGKKGVLEESLTGEAFVGPTGVAVAANGDIFVSDGHNPAQHGNHRIVKFSKDGTFIKTWGNHTGSANGEVSDPHGIAMDSQGRVFVADRGNRRIEVFDQNGGYIASWPQFGSCENIYITKDDTLYVTDSNSGGARNDSLYKRGIRVGSAKDGSVRYFIPEESYLPSQTATSGPVGLGVDAKGTIYAADVGATVGFDKMMKKYVR
jgi:sugar lactone lactonase YvrE